MTALLALPAETAARRWLGLPRPVIDALAFSVLAVIAARAGLTGLFGFAQLLPPVSPWWTLVTALPAASLALWKHRAPGAALGAATVLTIADLLTVGGLIPLFVLVDALYAAAVTVSPTARRRLLGALVLAVAALTLFALARTGDPRAMIMVAVQTGGILGMAYWFGTSVAQSRMLMDQSQELAELHRAAAENAARLAEQNRAEAVREEREQMARELHDVVAGHVAAVAIRSEATLAAPGADSPERHALRAIRDTSLHAHETLREMVAVLRSDHDTAAPARPDVPALAAQARAWGLDVVLDDRLTAPAAGAADQAVRRIVQEALANASRHAPGSAVRVGLSEEPGGIGVRILSTGGRRQAGLSGSGWGLHLLHERVAALGGSLEAGAAEDGWLVNAVVPRAAS
ncbi:sensor histidine kinase [Microbacterium sp. No. 7]|uniref:sensor histidine kinase n=1 Tax=Microbacterium sp. No. 7 TaxID=1714373 RepID=UPI0006D28A57|nr:sensor histidine kinase [Microbacterium sp. No. 7]ALJ21053.1 hypothetical protein AOA12_14550 [Microbacterium sp. No. 7]